MAELLPQNRRVAVQPQPVGQLEPIWIASKKGLGSLFDLRPSNPMWTLIVNSPVLARLEVCNDKEVRVAATLASFSC